MSSRDDDLVVVGASAGGIEPLMQLVARLPSDLRAAVLITVHVATTARGALPALLGRVSPLPSAHARHGEPVVPGRLVVAAPNHHLLVGDGTLQVTAGPREHGHRPSIDALFRSAAAVYGPRVIGVLLSGALDDGVAGLAAIARAGGRTIVQAPETAAYDSMPSHALEVLEPDAVLAPDKLAAGVLALVGNGRGSEADAEGLADPRPVATHLSSLSCPECAGVLWELDDPDVVTYRCRMGHTWSAASLAAANEDTLEHALWAAARVLEERAELYDGLASRARDRHYDTSASQFAGHARQAEREATMIRSVIERLPFHEDGL